MLRWQGNMRRSWEIEFTPKLKTVTGMCGAVVKNQLFLFGGSGNKVYHLVGCLMQVGTPLTFDFNHGICGTIDKGDRALLCSSRLHPTNCYKFNGLGYEKMTALRRPHNDGALAEAYGQYYVVAGGQDGVGGGGNLEVESFDPSVHRYLGVFEIKLKLYQDGTCPAICVTSSQAHSNLSIFHLLQ